MRYDDDTIANVLEGTAAKAQAKATAASARALSSLGSSAARCCKCQLALHHSTGTRSMVKEGCCNALVGLRKGTQLLDIQVSKLRSLTIRSLAKARGCWTLRAAAGGCEKMDTVWLGC